MSLSTEEFTAIVEGAADLSDYHTGQYFGKRHSRVASGPDQALRLFNSSVLPPWAGDLRRMLNAFSGYSFSSKQEPPIEKLCETGALYGLQELERKVAPKVLALVSQKARRSLRQNLQQILRRASYPSFELERTSYHLAMAAIGLAGRSDPKLVEQGFLGQNPGARLSSIFRRFPVLARIWAQLISQWCNQIGELLVRLAADKAALAHAFLGDQSPSPIVDMQCGLSDPHNEGRTVTLLQFVNGSVIYKPRSGDGEWEWGSLLARMNSYLFQPRLRRGRVLRRRGYCWTERIDRAPCKNKVAVRRYYQRLGGMIAAAYLLRAVDCHRDNIIVSGEHPVLVDADALWHVSEKMGKDSVLARLLNTGFFPDANPESLRSRSSVLGTWSGDNPFPRIGPRSIGRSRRNEEILNGFCRGWHCILGTPNRQRHFIRQLQRICSRKRRWICCSTQRYAAIREASIQGPALRSGIERDQLIARLSTPAGVNSNLIATEIDALKRLDIPYFQRRRKGRITVDPCDMPADIPKVLERLLG